MCPLVEIGLTDLPKSGGGHAPPALRTYTAQPTYVNRPVVPGVAEGAMAPPVFGRSVNPISTRGTDYTHLITTGTPGFSDLPTALSTRLKMPLLVAIITRS